MSARVPEPDFQYTGETGMLGRKGRTSLMLMARGAAHASRGDVLPLDQLERVLGLTRTPALARGSSAGTVLTVLAVRQHNTTSYAHACCVHASLTDRMPPPKC